ncbi:glycoside hydrolase family 130 protein [soil metagenome]
MNQTTYRGLIHLAFVATTLFCATSCSERQKPVTGWAVEPFIKVDSVNPVLIPGRNEFNCPIQGIKLKWDNKDVFNPAAVVKDDKIYLLFRAEDTIGKYAGTSRIGLAVSDDGLHFSKMAEPVLFPENDEMKIYEWEGGIEDPRVVESNDGKYILTYTAYDGRLARLCLATSTDLIHWNKHGLVFPGKDKDTWSKSGAIVAKRSGEKIIAEKINGKYWMYWGDTDLFLASSEDLIHWTALEDSGKIKSVLKPRKGYFDSRLVESGPYALVTEKGIVLLYNGMNLDGEGKDPEIDKGAYCSGQALFDRDDPSKLIDRLEKNFLRPDKPYEMEGQVNQVCFIEGMVPFKGNWFLYYGTADSKIGVATSRQ